jgi:hypothetical protein
MLGVCSTTESLSIFTSHPPCGEADLSHAYLRLLLPVMLAVLGEQEGSCGQHPKPVPYLLEKSCTYGLCCCLFYPGLGSQG